MNDISQIGKYVKHIAFIMDGNGRWAKEKGLERTKGHKKALENLIGLVEECSFLNIKYISLFAFSTENWNRPKLEISFLFKYLVIFFKKNLKRLINDNIQVVVSGDYKKLPKDCVQSIEVAKKETKKCNGSVLNICLNYGGKDELLLATKKIASLILDKKIKIKDIDNKIFEEQFFVSSLPDIDLMIRTSGEYRISNFMLYKLAYAEMMFPKTYFPDFDKNCLHKCLSDFLNRDRRFGGIQNNGK